MSFISQSQTDTSKICFEKKIVVAIQKDLIRGDYCDSIKKAQDTIIKAQNEKIIAKDSTLKAKNEQISLAKKNTSHYEGIVKVRDEEIRIFKKEVKKEKTWKNIHKIGNFVLPVVASYFTYRVLTR